MNKVIDREESTEIVSSKYFTSKSDMDESLSDFQEPKKLAGRKVAAKKTKSEKPKKAPKQLRGQKDIRKALRPKKNEYESYANDFDKVCKHAGLDVDSEQLQLAIALSRSLQQSVSTSSESPETSLTFQSLNSQDRVGKIRTTLLEYGFKVPEIKIKASSSKRLKKIKKYKLLLTSEETKKQIISDKYSQVLFENVTLSKGAENVAVDVALIKLYYLATNATYGVLKNINTFYVDGLLEKSTSTGNLLRDWSEIPGRPVSPKTCEPINMNFSEIECSQDELDIVLSGSLKSCKNIIRSKEKVINISQHNTMEYKKTVDNSDNSLIVLVDDENPKCSRIMEAREFMDSEEHKYKNETTGTKNDNIIDLVKPIINQYRSCSPDIFDDELSIVSDNIRVLSQEEKMLSLKHYSVLADNNGEDFKGFDKSQTLVRNHCIHSNPNLKLSQNTNVSRKDNDFMEITKCVEGQCMDMNNSLNITHISQNITKRKTNDFMEITSCVARQPFLVEGSIDLTDIPDNTCSTANEIIKDEGNVELLNELCENHETKIVQTNIDKNENTAESTSCEKLLKVTGVIEGNNVDLTESPEVVNDNAENLVGKSIESLDLTQSSDNSDELPFVSLKKFTKNQSADDTILITDLKKYKNVNNEFLDQNILREAINSISQKVQSNINDLDFSTEVPNIEINLKAQNVRDREEILDLTQEIVITPKQNSRTSESNVSFFEEYIHNHSGNNNEEINNDDYNVCSYVYKEIEIPANEILSTAKQNVSNDIDLTQDSESSDGFSQELQNSLKSIDYNVISNDIIETEIENGSQRDIDLSQNSDFGELSQDSRHQGSIKDHNINVESKADSDATINIDTDDNVKMAIIKSSQRCSSLGKKDDVSIDYDEIYDSLVNKNSNSQQSTGSKSATDLLYLCNETNKSKDLSNCSQNSEVFVISDNELDYSMHQSKLERSVDNFLFGGLSIMNELSGLSSFRKSINNENNSGAANQNDAINDVIEIEDYNQNENGSKTPVKHKRVNELATPQIPSCSEISTVFTPSNNEFVIKTNNVTPMPKYETMSLPDLHRELDNFGVKPFKRKQAIQLLTHIYNQTHPTIEPYSDDESPCKRRKIDHYDSPRKDSPKKLTPRNILSPKKSKSPKKISERKGNTKEKGNASKSRNERLINIEGIKSSSNNTVNETPIIKEVECSPEDWVFQKREKAKVHSCRVPLHVAFHNYVLSRRGIREAILCYEPINIDDIHKDLVAYGHRYDPKDLLKFMDKKCITVKTTDNDAKNNKR